MTRIGLVGCGRWGQHILRDLLALDCTVTVVERSVEGRDRARGLGAHDVVAAVDQLDPIDGVVVATPVATHATYIHHALDLGVPVFTEKAMTDDVHAADEIVDRAADRVFVMEKWRYHPAVIRLAELAHGGALGEITGMSTIRQQWGDSHPDTDPVWTLLPHDLSIANHVLGHIPTAVSARRLAGLVADTSGRSAPFDCAFAGLTGMLGGEGSPWLTVDVSARALRIRREVVLFGTAGTARLSDVDYGVVEIRSIADDDVRVEPVADTMPLLAELAAFLAYVDGSGPPPLASAAEGAMGVRRVAELRALAREASP